jgi:hypothetical protein
VTSCFHHGLYRLNPAIREKLKNRDILDAGASVGDSALVLSQYARSVHSLELGEDMFRTLNITLTANPEFCANVRPYLLGVSDTSSAEPGKVELTSVDHFVQKHNLTIGFIKADIEGSAFQMCIGAQNTFRNQRPVFSLASYHSFTELYDMSMWLTSNLVNYEFEWHMENLADFAFFEASIFGYPIEALRP